MKHKKLFVMIICLAVLLVCIIAACFFVNRGKNNNRSADTDLPEIDIPVVPDNSNSQPTNEGNKPTEEGTQSEDERVKEPESGNNDVIDDNGDIILPEVP